MKIKKDTNQDRISKELELLAMGFDSSASTGFGKFDAMIAKMKAKRDAAQQAKQL